MLLIKEIENKLPLVATLPEDWQKDVGLMPSLIIVAYDDTLTMTPDERRARRDRDRCFPAAV